MVPGMTEMEWRDNVRSDMRRSVKERKDGTRSRSQRRMMVGGGEESARKIALAQ